jgi:hypothetical protein
MAFSVWAESPFHLTFGADEVGKFLSGWTSLDGQNTPKIYSIQAEGGKKFIHAHSRGSVALRGLFFQGDKRPKSHKKKFLGKMDRIIKRTSP